MQTPLNSNAKRLLQFNSAVLGQALSLVAAHWQSDEATYSYPIGAHLRHVIEHYEALLLPKEPRVVDYDSRPRNRELQRNPDVALRRLRLLLRRLDDWTGDSLDLPVQVLGRGGLAGDFGFAVISSLGRELVFVASHAIHHYALIKPHCIQHGMAISAEFGRAPSTVAYQNASLADRLAA
jgi:hypothetical protein